MKTTEVNLQYYTPHHTTVHSTAGLFMLTQITDWMNGLIDTAHKLNIELCCK